MKKKIQREREGASEARLRERDRQTENEKVRQLDQEAVVEEGREEEVM